MSEALLPARGRFSASSEYRAAIDHLINQARQRIGIFDRDLQGAGFESAARADALRRFLLASRDNRLLIVLHDVGPLARGQPRLLALLRQFSHAIAIHETTREARSVYDTIIVADDAHYVHRFHFDQPRGEWLENDIAGCQGLARRFEEIWLASTPAVFATVLGL